MVKQKRFNKLPVSKQEKVLLNDGTDREMLPEVMEFMKTDRFGGPLVDTESLQIVRW